MNYFSKIAFALLLCTATAGSQAKSVYLSATGSDTNGGLSSGDAVASVTQAFALLADGDTIVVSGMIDLTQTPGFLTDGNSFTVPATTMGWTKGFAIAGADDASGFDGKQQGRFGNQIAGYNNANAVITFKKLIFKDCGKSGQSGGSVLRVLNNGGKIVIDGCEFTGSMGTQGSVFAYNSNIEVKNCKFYKNLVQQGGAMFFNGISTRSALIENCLVENNVVTSGGTPLANSHGGAFYITQNSSDVTIRNCIIRNDTISGYGAAVHIQATETKTAETAVESKVVIENTLITGCKSISHCPGIYINNTGNYFPVKLSLINCTLYDNASAGMGTIWIYNGVDGSELNLINCTIVENQGIAGTNAGHGPGVRINDTASEKMYKRFYNTIIQGNMSAGTAGNAGDVWLTQPQTDGVNCEFRNTYIGYINWGGTNPYAAANNYGNNIGYNLTGAAELAWPSADYIASRGVVPLDFESPCVTGGNAQYLQSLGINTDQEGTVRLFADGKCAIGACESTVVSGVISGEEHDYTHYIIYGQSLSTGHQSDPLSTTNVPGNYMLGDRIWVNNGNSTLNDLNPLVATTTSGSQSEVPLHGAVNHLRNKIPLTADANGKENRILASSAGTSGKPIEELSKAFQGTGSAYLYGNYQTAIKKAKSMVLRRNSTIHCPAIIWMQGEWNYQGYGTQLDGVSTPPTDDKTAYKNLMIQLKNDMQTDVKAQYEQTETPVFYTYQVGASYTKGLTLEIGMAQLEASNEHDDIVMIGPVYPYPDCNGHLDANGYRWYGELTGKVIYKTQVLGEKFAPLQPVKLSRVPGNPKQVRIQYYVPVPPLVFDTHTLLEMKDYGFLLGLNNIKKTITNIEIDGDCVVLTSDADLNGTVLVSYAGNQTTFAGTFAGANPTGNGNLRDSDNYGSFYTYVQRTWSDGNQTLSDHPRNESGNIIYDQPYPLWNFSVAYYYEIPAASDEYVVPNAPKKDGVGISGTKVQTGSALSQQGSDLFLTVSGKSAVKLGVYSLSGSLLKQFAQEQTPAGVQKYSLDALPQGLYVAKAQVGNNVYSAKIIIR
ncbi:MAG: T9SS type A sorting domain-containing protein [Prevotella sp.]|nr:T9SS type A sorting domain-containing protein [Prevotella sp.]